MKNKIKKLSKGVLLLIIIIAVVSPVIYMLADSVMSTEEIQEFYKVKNGNFMNFHLIPINFSLEQYYDIFFLNSDALKMFWNSLFYTVPIVVGQTIISIFAAYAFAKIPFPGRNFWFFICVVLMILPVQVSIVPNYIMLNKLNLLDTQIGIILPGIFSAFGVCLLWHSMKSVEESSIESARVEGAGECCILLKIVIPQVRGAITTLILLTFIDWWNVVEQPLVFLKDKEKYPLSLYLSTISEDKLGTSFACGVIFMIPIVLIYLYLRKDFIYSVHQGGER